MRTALTTAFVLLAFIPLTHAAEPTPAPLWSDGAPDAKGDKPHDIPDIAVYPVADEKSTGCGVVVFPGGGYGGLALSHEGRDIARWLNERGIVAFVVRYRLGSKGYRHPVMMHDGQRAVRWARHRAKAHGVDPARLGVWGFSAGGHLASTVATHFDAGQADAADPIDRVSSRPDFAVLAYPVITMDKTFTHMGSRRNLLGNEPSDDLVALMSNEKQVTKDTPPTFIFHTADDQAVPVRNAVEFYASCMRHGVKAELHIYQHGRHGGGLAARDPILRTWPDRLHDWMKFNKFTTDAK